METTTSVNERDYLPPDRAEDKGEFSECRYRSTDCTTSWSAQKLLYLF